MFDFKYMKKTLLLILYNLPLLIYSQKTVNVIAINGLKLRSTPNEKGLVLEKIPFGTNLTVLSNTKIACKPILIFKIDTVNADQSGNTIKQDLSLKGTFLKINFDGKIGYINDLFVSRVIPNFIFLKQKQNDKDIKPEAGTYFYLLNQHFKVKEVDKNELGYTETINEEKTTTITYTKQYPNGLHYTYRSDYTDNGIGGDGFILTAKNLSCNEAIMMAHLLFYPSNDSKDYKIGFEYDKENNIYALDYYGEGGGTSAKIYKNEKGYWVLEYSSGAC